MLTLGCDPEVFLRNKQTGEFVSAVGMFPGSKESPSPVFDENNVKRGAIQVDGNALEFNIEPASNEEEWVSNITFMQQWIEEKIALMYPDLEVAYEPIAKFDEAYFENLPFEAKQLGCDPDFNGITGKVLKAPDIQDVPLRTSSGHIHFGWDTMTKDPQDPMYGAERLSFVREMNKELMFIVKPYEKKESTERRKYYGRNGAWRPKTYGVELRSPDCTWLQSEDSIRTVYRQSAEKATKILANMGVAA